MLHIGSKSGVYNICYNMIDVFLLLGGNMGDRLKYLEGAVKQIDSQIGRVISVSGVFQTQSWGKTDEPDYLNQAVKVSTDKPARQVLELALAIERELGRERKEKWGSRTIDIDILLYGDAIINEPDLVVPHPGLPLRRFALEPLSEIGGNFVHPVLRKTINDLKNEVSDGLIVKKF